MSPPKYQEDDSGGDVVQSASDITMSKNLAAHYMNG
jgi:hypothetical protein